MKLSWDKNPVTTAIDERLNFANLFLASMNWTLMVTPPYNGLEFVQALVVVGGFYAYRVGTYPKES